MLSHFESPSDVNKQCSMIKATYINECHFSQCRDCSTTQEADALGGDSCSPACWLPASI